MTVDEVPLSGRTLILGPLQTGKTRLTAATLSRWVERHGSDGVVVLDLAPIIETDQGIIGGRLDRFLDVPETSWYGSIDARGPRSEADTPQEQLNLAELNSIQTRDLLDRAPDDPTAVFVNDITLGLQFDPDLISEFIDYTAKARCVVLNAYEGDELRGDDPISANERTAIERLRDWVDRTIELR